MSGSKSSIQPKRSAEYCSARTPAHGAIAARPTTAAAPTCRRIALGTARGYGQPHERCEQRQHEQVVGENADRDAERDGDEAPAARAHSGVVHEHAEGERQQAVERVRAQLAAVRDELPAHRREQARDGRRPQREQAAGNDDHQRRERRGEDDGRDPQPLQRDPGSVPRPGKRVPGRRSRLGEPDLGQHVAERRLDDQRAPTRPRPARTGRTEPSAAASRSRRGRRARCPDEPVGQVAIALATGRPRRVAAPGERREDGGRVRSGGIACATEEAASAGSARPGAAAFQGVGTREPLAETGGHVARS